MAHRTQWLVMFAFATAVAMAPAFSPTRALAEASSDASASGDVFAQMPEVTGANVDESAIALTLYIAPGGEDSHDRGTAAAPFATLSYALHRASREMQEGRGVRICLAPGVYRQGDAGLDARRWPEQARDAVLVIEGAGQDRTIISGADVWDDWQPTPGAGGVRHHDWPHDWGFGRNTWWDRFEIFMSALSCRREIVYLDGRPMRQVVLERWTFVDPDGPVGRTPPNEGEAGDAAAADDAHRDDANPQANQPGRWVYRGMGDPASLEPGTFAVAERDENGNRLYVHVPARSRRVGMQLEVGVRSRLLTILGKHNVVLRGLAFVRAANFPTGRPAVFLHEVRNVLVDNCRFEWNNGVGLSLGNEPRDVTIRDSIFDHNGWRGLGAGRPDNMLMQNNRSCFNNWRGHWGGRHGWDAAAVKIMGPGQPTGLRVVGHTSLGNLTHGFWLDHCETETAPATFEQCQFIDSRFGQQLYLEKQAGPIVVRHCVLLNRAGDRAMTGIGRNFKIENSLLADIGDREPHGQLIEFGRRSNSPYRYSRQWTIRDSVLLATGPKTVLFNWHREEKEQAEFMSTYRGEGNVFFHPARGDVFWMYYTRPFDFTAWRERTGQDATSRWLDPAMPNLARLDLRSRRLDVRKMLGPTPLTLSRELLLENERFLREYGGPVDKPEGPVIGAIPESEGPAAAP